ncbi:MAG: hypothetical protein ABIQ16_01515 [Polyangiaceae bacterium]
MSRFGASLLSLAVPACGGGVPLLHPAHALAPGRTAFAVGVSDRFALGDEKKALDYAQQRPPNASPSDPRYGLGVVVALAEGPAVAPYVSARVGIPASNEAGLSYSGQAVRIDARHAFEWDQSALSAGLGLTGRGFGQSPLDLPGTDLDRARGFGVDLPLLYGYRTDADLISVWAGLRGSLDHWSGDVSLDELQPYKLSANRLALGPVLGVAIGLPPLWVAAELEVDYAHVSGSLSRSGAHYDTNLDGVSVRPAGALIARF